MGVEGNVDVTTEDQGTLEVKHYLYRCPHCEYSGCVTDQGDQDKELMICCEGCEKIIWIEIAEEVVEGIKLKGFGLSFYGHNIGAVWDTKPYPLHLSIFLPFITITIGFGKIKYDNER